MAAELPGELCAVWIPSLDLSRMNQDRLPSDVSGYVIPYLVADCAVAG
jgi:hypothetical protein